jgi:hypothetical protein
MDGKLWFKYLQTHQLDNLHWLFVALLLDFINKEKMFNAAHNIDQNAGTLHN